MAFSVLLSFYFPSGVLDRVSAGNHFQKPIPIHRLISVMDRGHVSLNHSVEKQCEFVIINLSNWSFDFSKVLLCLPSLLPAGVHASFRLLLLLAFCL